MNVSIFGMGYVGCVTAACLIKQGHSVFAVEVIADKIEKLEKGEWPVFEPGLDDLNGDDEMDALFSVSAEAHRALEASDVSIVCVGTPDLADGSVDLAYLHKVIEEIRSFVTSHNNRHVVLIRSTVPMGTTESILSIAFGGQNEFVQIGFLPEFLREGNAINDFFSPGLKVVGSKDDFPFEILDELFRDVQGEWVYTDYRTAESIKYICNVWHALKITFTNEIATILKSFGVDGEGAMSIFSMDNKLNISSAYMRPGFAYGGSCLPKDLKALISLARSKIIDTPLLNAIAISNDRMVESLESLLHNLHGKSIGFAGVSFKPDTDDIRNSPIVELIVRLKSGEPSYRATHDLFVTDDEAALLNFGNEFGQLAKRLDHHRQLVDRCDIIVLGPFRIEESLLNELVRTGKTIVDLKWHGVGSEIKNYELYYHLV